MKINYIQLVDFFTDIINDIRKKQYEITGFYWKKNSVRPSEELLEKARSDELSFDITLDKAFDLLRDVKELIDLQNQNDFESFALSNLRNAKLRIENVLKNGELDYPDYDLDKYDHILEDFYHYMNYCESSVDKYRHITYLRTQVNLGLCHDIDNIYELLNEKYFEDFKDSNVSILDEIVELIKQLHGFIPPTDKEDKFVNYYRWQKHEG